MRAVSTLSRVIELLPLGGRPRGKETSPEFFHPLLEFLADLLPLVSKDDP